MQLLRIDPDKTYIFVPEFIWDGVSADLLSKCVVSVKNGVIDYIGPAQNLKLTSRVETETVELPGNTLMPGLIDCHIHLAMNCSDLLKAVNDWETSPQQALTQAKSHLQDYLRNGVVAVRDGGDKANIGIKTRRLVNSENSKTPAITTTGTAIYKKGMYGHFLGPGISSLEEALKQVEDLKTEGVDQIKIINSGLVSFKNYGSIGTVHFSTEELREITEKAHSLGLKVMTHASSARAVEISVQAGVDSVEHGYFLERHQLELMAHHKTAWIPTLAPLGNLVRDNHIPYPEADLDIIKRSFERQLEMVREAYKTGVVMGIGTDAGANQVLHGFSYHDEIAYYSDAGIDRLSILKMATSVAAGIISKDKKLGVISTGALPFLCSIRGNPLNDLQILKTPEAVIISDSVSS